MRALVIEDDPDVGPDVVRALEASGFLTDLVVNGEDAWYRGDVEEIDVAVLDLGLPRLDGISVLKRWREAGRSFPVLILSARSDWIEKVEGIEAGADDYLGKPFEMGELVTRVRALVRRASGHAAPSIDLGDLRIDTRRRAVTVGGAPAELSQLEFRLLNYLAHQADRTVSAGELADHLYGAEESGDSNAIEALILRLRRKIGAARIVTRRGFGYQVVPISR
ncbi:DNA-binding response regulator [Sphingomonas gilva]|uniref:DNA-binding response regulator n=1 Tax=Sphingomonas gilva TaxID=2305907 RepID=A0A396RUT7_9SPHN|nr:response regulator transcription factor [Sphingomonas gilva]RHW18223.1 DNA-binding response regulator [Sphingomonas gilva]